MQFLKNSIFFYCQEHRTQSSAGEAQKKKGHSHILLGVKNVPEFLEVNLALAIKSSW